MIKSIQSINMESIPDEFLTEDFYNQLPKNGGNG